MKRELRMSDPYCQREELKSIEEIICWGLSQLARPFDSPALIKALLEALQKVTGSGRTDLLLFQSDMNILFFADSASDASKLSLADTKNSVPVQALAGGHTVLVSDVTASNFVSLSSGTRTLLGIPVIFGERIHGVLSLEHASPSAFSDDSVRRMEALTGMFSILLEQSFLAEQIFRLNQRLIDQMTQSVSESDPGYKAHAERVSTVAGAIAEEMGLSPDTVRAIRDSGYLHDVGKSGVSQTILVKPGSLNSEEVAEVRRHPVLGRFLLKPLGFQPIVIEGVASHHERWDGAGYPRGLTGEQIPVAGRILAVAEAYDVMTSDQAYRERIPKEKAIEEIKSQKGRQFDPGVVDALLRLREL
jgi:putative nucleotidyltransferase with HDIG domain